MFDRLRNFLSRKSLPTRVPEFEDPVLGRLVLAQKSPEWWEAIVSVGGRPVTIAVGGKTEPDAVLLARARDLVANDGSLEKQMSAFLAREAERRGLRAWAPEIETLRIASVNLFWPDRPRDGMVYFEGPSDDRVWRCDIIDGEPRGLGFDS